MNIGLYCWNTEKAHRVCIDSVYSSVFSVLGFSCSLCARCVCSGCRLSLDCMQLEKSQNVVYNSFFCLFLKIWFQKKRSCHSSPDGRWNHVLYERGCLLKVITCDIYGFAKIFDFILDCDFNVLFDFDSTRVILNENRDLVFFVLQDSLMAVHTWTHLGLLREPMRFYLCSHRKQQASSFAHLSGKVACSHATETSSM